MHLKNDLLKQGDAFFEKLFQIFQRNAHDGKGAFPIFGADIEPDGAVLTYLQINAEKLSSHDKMELETLRGKAADILTKLQSIWGKDKTVDIILNKDGSISLSLILRENDKILESWRTNRDTFSLAANDINEKL